MTAPVPKNASSMPETATAIIKQTPSRFSSLVSLDDLTPDYVKQNYLTGFDFAGNDGQVLAPSFFDEKMADAIARVEKITGVDILPREIISEQHDYHTNDYLNYAYMQLYRMPVRSVTEVRASYPTGQVIQVFPSDWVRLYVEHGQFHLVPTSGSLAQVLLGGGNGYLPFIFAGLSYLPNLWQVDYTSGFDPDAIPRDIASVLCKIVAIEILTIMSDLVGPLGVASSSLGIDGMSQSIARQLPAFKARIDAYRIDVGLPGTGLGVDPKYGSGELAQIRRNYVGFAAASL